MSPSPASHLPSLRKLLIFPPHDLDFVLPLITSPPFFHLKKPRIDSIASRINPYIYASDQSRPIMTTTNPTTEQASEIPVLLLKTRSSPGDSYEDLFSESNVNASGFAPQFVPVLLHQFHSDGMNEVAALLRDRRIGNQKHHEYGGLIFTSQRAVEAFVKLVEDGKAGKS